MPLTVSVSLMVFAVVLGLIPFFGLAGRPLLRRITVALSAPALVALLLFAPWDTSPTWQWKRTLFSVALAILLAVAGYFDLRQNRTLLPFFLVPAVFGLGMIFLTAEKPFLSRAFWVEHEAPGRDLVSFSALAVAVLAYWLWRRRDRRAGH
jgi:phosphoglycerol transferase MdoB-like AlkP superfamily enzyme